MVPIDPVAVRRKEFLTDKEWDKIVRSSGLPPDARASVDVAIDTFRFLQRIADVKKTPAETRAELCRLSKDAEALATRLFALRNDADAYIALFHPIPPPNGWPARTGPVPYEVVDLRLSTAVFELERLSIWLGLARDRVRRRKTGASRQAATAYTLVNRLNHILEQFTGETITRSIKSQASEYVKIVCRIADPKMGLGTISEAMKKQIKHYKPVAKLRRNRKR